MEIRSGARLRYPIYDDRGVLLLKEGATLTPTYASLLERRGIRVQLHARLEILGGGPVGQSISIPDSCTVTIGRNEGCMIRPTSPLVSGYHCVIVQVPLALLIEDMGSTNGTFVNDRRIHEPTELDDGDRLRFGDVIVVVRLHASLEGQEEHVQAVAGLILAEESGVAGPIAPPGGATLASTDAQNLETQRKLEELWRRRQGRERTT